MAGAAEAAKTEADLAQALGRRTIEAAPIEGEAPRIDGRLDESCWQRAVPATDFVEQRPVPGRIATLATEARFLYDEGSLYVGIRAFDPESDTILAPWPRRDDETTSDWLFVELDSRHDRRTAFSFGVNPRGVQVDGTFANDTVFDVAWDGVWESAARIDAEGWTAEIRIPFSQLPYTAGEGGEAVWGVNVYRFNPHRGETSNWSPRLPSLAGVVSNFNELRLHLPPHPHRLELVPYVAATGDRTPGTEPATTTTERIYGGLDARVGLSTSFLLSAAVHPDFSQVEADPSEVNLTTFETFFTERRPLFVESESLFRFDAGLPFTTRGISFEDDQPFYSRRIGRPPRGLFPEGVRGRAPDASTLTGAVKLTGRTATGWSAGALWATTATTTGEGLDPDGMRLTVPLEPETHYAAARASRDFRRGSSAIGGFTTLVVRPGLESPFTFELPSGSMAAGIDGRHRFLSDRYEVTGFALATRVTGTSEALVSLLHGPGHYLQRPDAEPTPVGTAAAGVAGQVRFAKIGGEHWRFSLAGHALSPRLEWNDLGFQRDADWLLAVGSWAYRQDRPGRWFRRWSVGSNRLGWGWSFGGERRAAVFDAGFDFDLNNYWGGGLRFAHELAALDTEALRGGPALFVPPRDGIEATVYSDQRRASQFLVSFSAYRDRENTGTSLSLSPEATVRLHDRFAFSLGPSFERRVNDFQFVGNAPGSALPLVARLDQTTMAITLRADLAFSSTMTLQVYAQPFASRGRFGDDREVVAPREERRTYRYRSVEEAPPAGVSSSDFAVTDFRMNVVLRWEYRPGSRFYLVWSQARHDETSVPYLRFPGDALAAFDAPASNRLLVKLSFWASR